ncbi:hypothetical protein CPC08DRAFT_765412 [Agrocybe pediades]|nr:hypothetical protein CPC08DRAFT_765412 [Agrocybe pediades]
MKPFALTSIAFTTLFALGVFASPVPGEAAGAAMEAANEANAANAPADANAQEWWGWGHRYLPHSKTSSASNMKSLALSITLTTLLFALWTLASLVPVEDAVAVADSTDTANVPTNANAEEYWLMPPGDVPRA